MQIHTVRWLHSRNGIRTLPIRIVESKSWKSTSAQPMWGLILLEPVHPE